MEHYEAERLRVECDFHWECWLRSIDKFMREARGLVRGFGYELDDRPERIVMDSPTYTRLPCMRVWYWARGCWESYSVASINADDEMMFIA